MPIRKFRSIEEMNQVQWRKPGSPELYEAIRSLWELGERTSKKHFRPGVYRYRTLEEMQAAAASLVVEDEE